MKKTLANGKTLETKGYIVYVDGDWQVSAQPKRLPNPVKKDGETYTCRIGKYGFTDTEISIIDQEQRESLAALERERQAELAKERKAKKYDNVYNEGGEGYNPHRK